MPDLSSLLAAALDCAARGWHVFPLRPDIRNPADEDHAKRPAFPNRCTAGRCDQRDPRCKAAARHVGWEDRATTGPDRIRRAWSAHPYGIGIACGPSGLVVIDCDTPKPNHTPPDPHGPDTTGLDVLTALAARHRGGIEPTYATTTGRDGTHLYYQHPTSGPQLRNTTSDRGNGLGWLVDTRAGGGYVVAAGSTVNARPYEVVLECEPAPLPDWLAVLLRPAEPAGPRKVVGNFSAYRRDAYVRGAVYRTIDKLAEARQPGRNNALFVAAATLGQLVAGGALTETEVYEALTPTALAIELTSRETERAIRSGLAAGAQRPRWVA